jgi:cation diffusion facilitator family transporter
MPAGPPPATMQFVLSSGPDTPNTRDLLIERTINAGRTFQTEAGLIRVEATREAMAAGKSSNFVIYAALAGNLLVALTKFCAATWTGSSAMLSEGVHSLVDTTNQVLLLYGIRRAARPPDAEHPLGHGRELYFWSFIVALLIFSLGAGISVYEGITHIQHPVTITDPAVNFVVLGLSALFEGVSWMFAFRAFERRRGRFGYIEAATRSRDPTNFMVLFEDTAALTGIAIAFVGTLLAVWLDMPLFDGLASLGIGAVLAATAIFLARESKGLLIGEPARESVRRSLYEIAQQQPGVDKASNLITMHMAPDQVVVAMDLDFSDALSTADIERSVAALERRMKEVHPEVIAVFAKPKEVRAASSVQS